MKNRKIYLLASLVMMLGLGLWLTGCESDTVAPHDETPELTGEDVAYQAAAMASATGLVLPQLVEYNGTDKNAYSYDFPAGGDISGTINFDFRTGGADGTPAPYNTADWGRLFTAAGEEISFAVGIGGSVELTFDIFANITRSPDTATLLTGSAGTFTSGAYSATFSFADLVVIRDGDYPASGTMTFVSGLYTVTVTFDGTNMAMATLTGGGSWYVNLDTGAITPVDG